MSKQIYKLTIEPITCVHIGTGKQLTMLDYMVTESEEKQPKYIKFSSDKLLQRIATDKERAKAFDTISSSNDMKEIMDFFHKNCNPNEDTEYACEITKDFYEVYTRNREEDPYETATFVEQIYRPKGSNTPVIPGSSLKGALRTAILNKQMHELSDTDYNEYYNKLDKTNDKQKLRFEKELQSKLLGDYKDAKKDPFRGVEISDCIFAADNTQIVGLIKNVFSNAQTGELFEGSIPIQAEAIKGSLMGSSVKTVSHLRINSDLVDTKALSMSINVQDIIQSCNYFYLREFKKEYEAFYQNASIGCDLIAKLKPELTAITETKNQFIIRVGRWSQVEFITFEENFRRLPSGEGTGSTRTLFNFGDQYLPFGWCKCTLEVQ